MEFVRSEYIQNQQVTKNCDHSRESGFSANVFQNIKSIMTMFDVAIHYRLSDIL